MLVKVSFTETVTANRKQKLKLKGTRKRESAAFFWINYFSPTYMFNLKLHWFVSKRKIL